MVIFHGKLLNNQKVIWIVQSYQQYSCLDQDGTSFRKTDLGAFCARCYHPLIYPLRLLDKLVLIAGRQRVQAHVWHHVGEKEMILSSAATAKATPNSCRKSFPTYGVYYINNPWMFWMRNQLRSGLTVGAGARVPIQGCVMKNEEVGSLASKKCHQMGLSENRLPHSIP